MDTTAPETPETPSSVGERLEAEVREFIAVQGITCAETICQCDRVIQNAYEFIERLCDITGYAGDRT